MPKAAVTLLAVTRLSREQRFCRLLRHTLREAPHQPPSRTLMAACGWRALMARIASPLSGMATSDHSCSGDAPLGFGSTVTIFHPVVMHLRLSLVPALLTARLGEALRCCAFVLALLLHRGLARNHGELRRRALERLPGLRATVQVSGHYFVDQRPRRVVRRDHPMQ